MTNRMWAHSSRAAPLPPAAGALGLCRRHQVLRQSAGKRALLSLLHWLPLLHVLFIALLLPLLCVLQLLPVRVAAATLVALLVFHPICAAPAATPGAWLCRLAQRCPCARLPTASLCAHTLQRYLPQLTTYRSAVRQL
eukprot:362387-Chlamydomonas_euryale.AAC.1